jgi:hypothetical protein
MVEFFYENKYTKWYYLIIANRVNNSYIYEGYTYYNTFLRFVNKKVHLSYGD